MEDGKKVLSHTMFSQIATHRKTGGVVPEVAAREHAVKIIPVIDKTFQQAGKKLTDIDAIAVTYGPGLIGSLLVGTTFANTLATVLKKPLIPVNHIEGHIYANWLENIPQFPIVVLTVSGGHNELILWKGHGSYRVLGSTLDDAAGEAFDKVARLLGLPYPGGPAIQRVAARGNPEKFPLPRPYLQPWNPEKNEHNFDFSFSGLKTAVLYLLRKKKHWTAQKKADIAASFQESVCEVLSDKLLYAAKKYRAEEIHLAGGVSANARLRQMTEEKLQKIKNLHAVRLHAPQNLVLCTDNAIMIAIAGYYKYKAFKKGRFKYQRPLIPNPNLRVRNWVRR